MADVLVSPITLSLTPTVNYSPVTIDAILDVDQAVSGFIQNQPTVSTGIDTSIGADQVTLNTYINTPTITISPNITTISAMWSMNTVSLDNSNSKAVSASNIALVSTVNAPTVVLDATKVTGCIYGETVVLTPDNIEDTVPTGWREAGLIVGVSVEPETKITGC